MSKEDLVALTARSSDEASAPTRRLTSVIFDDSSATNLIGFYYTLFTWTLHPHSPFLRNAQTRPNVLQKIARLYRESDFSYHPWKAWAFRTSVQQCNSAVFLSVFSGFLFSQNISQMTPLLHKEATFVHLQSANGCRVGTLSSTPSAGLTMWQMWQMPRASGLRGPPKVEKSFQPVQNLT